MTSQLFADILFIGLMPSAAFSGPIMKALEGFEENNEPKCCTRGDLGSSGSGCKVKKERNHILFPLVTNPQDDRPRTCGDAPSLRQHQRNL